MFTEHRQSVRKVLKTKAVITMDGAAPLAARTVDVSAEGASLSVAGPIPVGQSGLLSFDLYFDGVVTPIRARARTTYCIFSSDQFKVGLQFLNLDLGAMTVLAKFLR